MHFGEGELVGGDARRRREMDVAMGGGGEFICRVRVGSHSAGKSKSRELDFGDGSI